MMARVMDKMEAFSSSKINVGQVREGCSLRLRKDHFSRALKSKYCMCEDA